MTANIPLEYIDPNPYQTRLREDPGHIQELAESIRKGGLLQVPVGRLVAVSGLPRHQGHPARWEAGAG